MPSFFFLSDFSFMDTDDSQDNRWREGTILYSTITSTRSWTFRNLLATLHVRWLSHAFNRTACNYSIRFATLSNYHLIDWLMVRCLFLFCLLDDLVLGFCYSNLTREANGFELALTYHRCVTSEPTNQVC